MVLPAGCRDLKQSKMSPVLTILGTVLTVCTAPFSMQVLGDLLSHGCCVVILSNKVYWVVFVMEMQDVFCEAVTEFLIILTI